MSDSEYEGFDVNNDGKVSDEELEKIKKIRTYENEDKKEDAQRNMAWFALFGMLVYPLAVVFAIFFSLDAAAQILGDMAPTYFVSVAGIVAAFYGKEAFVASRRRNDDDDYID